MPTHSPFTDQPESWWNPDGPYWTLHAINPLRQQFVLQHIAHGDALDIGCGGGIFSEALARNFNVTGIDIDDNLIKIAQSRQSNITYQHGSLADIKEQRYAYFDLVTCLEVLEHVHNPQNMINEIAYVTKPQGLVFFSTLNRNLVSFLGAIVAAEHVFKLLPKHTHEYSAFIKPQELITWAQSANLYLKDIKGILYHPITRSFSLGSSTLINYIACFEKR